jgi:glycosyltransferase involved in cell wall biosynthesis
MSKKLRIFINSNAPWATSGYSNQISEILPLIHNEGYPLAMTDFFGLEGGKLMIDGVLHYPKINHVYGSDALVHHAKDFNADVCFTLQDVWVLNPHDLERTKRFIPILPIDHDPAPRIVIEKLKYAYRIVTYSKFGQKELQKNGFMSTYIPHTVNTEIFKPIDKQERKKLTGLALDSYVFGMVAANKENPPRKSFQEVLDAFKMFLAHIPNAILYIHTNPNFPGGFPIQEYAKFIGIQDKILFPDFYQMNFNTGKAEMNLIYNTFDCLLMPSISEGFGVPAIEAQSCGVPVIVNNWTSMPELVIKGETGDWCEILTKRFSGLGSYNGVPDTRSLLDAMMRVYKADRIKMGKAARKYIMNNYDTKKVFDEKWKVFLQKLENEIYHVERSI